MHNILVPIDFSKFATQVIKTATEHAQAFSAKLWLLHVAAPDPDFVGYEPGPKTVRDQLAAEFREEHRKLEEVVRGIETAGLDAASLMVQGVASESILDHAKRLDADLIVMGSHGFGAIKRALLGSVSAEVLRKSECPVLVVPMVAES